MIAPKYYSPGTKFGRLKLIKEVERTHPEKRRFLFKCDCGTIKELNMPELKNGMTKSCGCLRKSQQTSLKHGMSNTPEYKVWINMIARCYNKTDSTFSHYGRRGIRVCNYFRTEFMNFFSDLGKRPSKQYSIDRINNNGHYSCGHCRQCLSKNWATNCRWSTQSEQMNNRRTNRIITAFGVSLTTALWAKKIKFPSYVIKNRIKNGWNFEIILTTPAYDRKQRTYRIPDLSWLPIQSIVLSTSE